VGGAYEVEGSGARGQAVVVVGDMLADVALVAAGAAAAAGALLVAAEGTKPHPLVLVSDRRQVARPVRASIANCKYINQSINQSTIQSNESFIIHSSMN